MANFDAGTDEHTASPTYYQVLGLGQDASADQVERAWRKRARDGAYRHPDLGGSDQGFALLNEAHQVLSDEVRRYAYDVSLGLRTLPPLPKLRMSDAANLAIMVNQHLAPAAPPYPAPRGADSEVSVDIDLATALFGGQVRIQLFRMAACDRCAGSGDERGQLEVCARCNGEGLEQIVERHLYGRRYTRRLCRRCTGDGKVVGGFCRACKGQGRVRTLVEVKLNVPYGWNGAKLRIAGAGDAGVGGGKAGSLYVRLVVREHPFYINIGQHLALVWPDRVAVGEVISVPVLTAEGSQLIEYQLTSEDVGSGVAWLEGWGAPYRCVGRASQKWQRGDLLVCLPHRQSQPALATDGTARSQRQAVDVPVCWPADTDPSLRRVMGQVYRYAKIVWKALAGYAREFLPGRE